MCELNLKSGLWADCMLVTFCKRGRDEIGTGLQSSPGFAPWSSYIHLEKERPLYDFHKVLRGLRVAMLECIWYSWESICEDTLEFEQVLKVMGNLKSRPLTKIRSVLKKDPSGCILEDGNSGGKETSERGLVQVRNNGGNGGRRGKDGVNVQKIE